MQATCALQTPTLCRFLFYEKKELYIQACRLSEASLICDRVVTQLQISDAGFAHNQILFQQGETSFIKLSMLLAVEVYSESVTTISLCQEVLQVFVSQHHRFAHQ